VDTSKRIIAAAQLLLLLPACVFMASLGMRALGMPQSGPAQAAQQIVTWYSLRMWTLWMLLIALPLAALVIGCAALLRSWNEDAAMRQAARRPRNAIRDPITMLFIAAVTLTAGVFLAVVFVHMLMN
jgi:hypothetical protein